MAKIGAAVPSGFASWEGGFLAKADVRQSTCERQLNPNASRLHVGNGSMNEGQVSGTILLHRTTAILSDVWHREDGIDARATSTDSCAMAFETNSKIDIPPFVLKLKSTFPKNLSFGTGFIVDYNECSWLFTCWHNIGPVRSGTRVDLTGEMTATHIAFVASGVQLALDGRRVVGARIGEEPVDVAAIEITPHEKPPPPWFAAKRELTLKGFNLPPEFELGGHAGGERIIVPVKHHYLWQGFSGTDALAAPTAFLAVDFPGSKSRHPWMLRYTPGGLPGTSGCPVQLLEGNRARIAGIHIHHYSSGEENLLQFEGRSSVDGRPIVAHASFEWGAAVPVELLYRAIDLASGSGVSIVNLAPEAGLSKSPASC